MCVLFLMSKMCEATSVKTKSLRSQTLKAHDVDKHITNSSKEIVLVGHNHIIEVKVTNSKGQKRTSPVASSGQKAGKKTPTTNDSKTSPSWGKLFGQQNLKHMLEESVKHSQVRKAKNDINAEEPKSPIKHHTKSKQTHSTTCCSSVLVQDRAVQCSIILNSNNFAEFNPVHMLYLINQLKDLVNRKDERICKIFTEMEQILQKIPDTETRIESSTASTKKMKAMSYEPFILEQEKLKSEILKRDEQLKEANRKYADLTSHADLLTQKLHEETCKENDISSLKQKIRDNEAIITYLKADLNMQKELARKNDVNNKYLKIEKDKLLALASCKDTQIDHYRSTIQELQNQITEQLKIVNEIYTKQGSASPQMSLIHTGRACSSPTSSFSDGSWNDLSDNISSVNSVAVEHALRRDAPVRDFELVSLLDGESSHTILPDENEVTNDKGSSMKNNNENNIVLCQNVNANDATAKTSLHHSLKKSHNKENDKVRKFTRLEVKQSDNIKNLLLNASKVVGSIAYTKSTVSDIRKQSDMQNRKPVNVPSPLQDCPYPDWSDSSLPSISTVSNLDMVPSNDV